MTFHNQAVSPYCSRAKKTPVLSTRYSKPMLLHSLRSNTAITNSWTLIPPILPPDLPFTIRHFVKWISTSNKQGIRNVHTSIVLISPLRTHLSVPGRVCEVNCVRVSTKRVKLSYLHRHTVRQNEINKHHRLSSWLFR